MSSTNQQEEKMSFWTANNGNVQFITATLSWVEEQDFDEWGQLLNFVVRREPEPEPEDKCYDCKKTITFRRKIDNIDYCLGCAEKHEKPVPVEEMIIIVKRKKKRKHKTQKN